MSTPVHSSVICYEGVEGPAPKKGKAKVYYPAYFIDDVGDAYPMLLSQLQIEAAIEKAKELDLVGEKYVPKGFRAWLHSLIGG